MILASILKKEKMKICCKNVTRNCQFATKYPCIVDSISFGYNKHKSCPKLRTSHNIFVKRTCVLTRIVVDTTQHKSPFIARLFLLSNKKFVKRLTRTQQEIRQFHKTFSIVFVNNLLSSPNLFHNYPTSLCSSSCLFFVLHKNFFVLYKETCVFLQFDCLFTCILNKDDKYHKTTIHFVLTRKTVVFFSVIQQINNNEHNVVHVTTFAHIFQLITHESFSFNQVSFLCHSYFGLINDVLVFTFLSSPFQNSVSSKHHHHHQFHSPNTTNLFPQ